MCPWTLTLIWSGMKCSSSVPLLNRLMMRLSWSRRLKDMITQAGMKTKPGKLLLFSGVTGMAAYVVTSFFYRPFSAALVAALFGAALPIAVVSLKRRSRLRQFEQRFPEALDLLGRAVRAGHAFTAGVEMVSMESPEPVAGEFRITFEEQNFGLPLRDALMNMAERVPLVDMRFLVTALLVQKEAGGNLAELLGRIITRHSGTLSNSSRSADQDGAGTPDCDHSDRAANRHADSDEVVNPSYVQVLFDDPLGAKAF